MRAATPHGRTRDSAKREAGAATSALGAAPVAIAPRPEVVYVNAPSPKASANAFALSNRSAGNFSNALVTALATLGGTDLRASLMDRGSSVRIRTITACADAAVCGGSPVSISYSTQPTE